MKPTALVTLACVGLLVAAAAGEEAALPVTKVTAFNSGVAYFEHSGDVTDNTQVLLKFRTEQINDILKSLVVLDSGGGDVTSVSYGSRDPLSRALKSFGVDISGEPTLGQLLKQIRGAEVVVDTPEPVAGKVLGVEIKRRHILPSNTIITQEILNLLTKDGLKAIALDSIAALKLADEKLNGELNKALALIVESRDTNRKPVTINFVGKGKRAVRVAYITEAPVWKTSYRLVLDAGDKKDELFLQGWAIVENTGDSDWEKVALTLVSGRPISFVQDLYTPLYLRRPVVVPQLYASLRPKVYDEGLADEDKAVTLEAKMTDRYARGRAKAAAPRAPARAGGAAGSWGRSGLARAGEEGKSLRLDQSVRSVARGGEVGELFSYRIATPVTLERRKSAMLVIVNQAVGGRKVSIYNAATLAKHPLNGLWLANDTGLSLLAGPVTIFDGGTYAGDAQIGNLTPGDKRLLSYAIDLKVTVDPTSKSSNRITAVTINRGVMHITRRYTYEQTYVIKNKADDERVMVVEHPRRSDRKLVEPKEPAEKTPGVYRFELKVAAAQTGKFEVREERSMGQTVAILPADVGSLKWYSTSKEIPKKVRQAIAEAIKHKNALTLAEREVRDLEKQINDLRREQDHIRRNMGALSRSSTGFKRFEKKLLDHESKIEGLQTQLEDAKANVKSLRKALEDYLNKLDVK